MSKLAYTIALFAVASVPLPTFAADHAQAPSPGSSTAVQPQGRKHSPGTVGAMQNDPEGGSFTASKSAEKKVKLQPNK